MIELKPEINHHIVCSYCDRLLEDKKVIWQGIHVCVYAACKNCNREYIEDMPIGHAAYYPYKVELPGYLLAGNEKTKKWLGEPFRQSLMSPRVQSDVVFEVKKRSTKKKILILNCIDYLYGHSLLKLLNAQKEYEDNPDLAVVVLVQTALEWLVPQFVSEVWTVNIPFINARNYYPYINECIQKELLRFEKVYVSYACSHPGEFDIENFTGIPVYRQETERPQRISFIWREDRFWIKNHYLSKAVQKYPKLQKVIKPLLYYQKRKVIRLFSMLKKSFPQYYFTVVGLGVTGKFPHWIQDHRVKSYNKESEYATCQIYSQSKLVIGIHGSNMLLPSAQAGMTLDLMPADRWGNYAQDILFQEEDGRIASYRYRFVPVETKMSSLKVIIKNQIKNHAHFLTLMEKRK